MAGPVARPKLSEEELKVLVRRFGLPVEGLDFKELPSYDDLNFRLTLQDGQRFVLKVHNAALPCGTRERLEAQDRLIARLHEAGLPVPKVVSSPEGGSIITLEPQAPGAPPPLARLLTYLEGDIVPTEEPKDAKFLQGVGQTVGQIASALSGFEDPGAHWTWQWDMRRAPEVVRSKLSYIQDDARRELATRLADEYAEVLDEKTIKELPQSVQHADLNDTNLLFREGEVVGILDFGDSMSSCRVFEPAIAAGYYSLGQADPLTVLCEVLRGYLRTAPSPLSETELRAYFQAARGRVLLSVVSSAEYCSHEPDNEYLAHTAEPGWAVLAHLSAVSEGKAMACLKEVALSASSP